MSELAARRLADRAARQGTALRALLARNMWADEADDRRLYVAGHGLTGHETVAIVESWAELEGIGPAAVVGREELPPQTGPDGAVHYVTAVTVEYGG